MRTSKSLNSLFLCALSGALFGSGAATAEEQESYEDVVLASLAPVPGGLTADQAAARAVSTSPDLAARRAEIDLAQASQDRTLSRFLPRVTLSARATYTNAIDFNFGGGALSVGALNPGALVVGACPDGSGNNCVVDSAGDPVAAFEQQPFNIPRSNFSLVADASVPLSDYLLSLPAAQHASRSDLHAAELRRDGSRDDVSLQARVAFYNWLRARAQLAVAQQTLASALSRLADAKVGLANGTLARPDVLQFESLEASSRIAVVNARSGLEQARVNLATIMGTGDTHFAVGEDVRAPLADGEAMSLEKLEQHARTHRPEILALDESARSARESAKGAAAALYPRLDGIANITDANPNPQFFPPERAWNTSWYIGLNLSWGLDRFFEARAQKNELEANARRFDAQRAGLVRSVTLQVSSAWQAWRRAANAAVLGQKDLEAAEAAYSQRVALYQEGEATTSEVLDAEVQRFNATLRVIDARIDARIARARLARAAATDRAILGPPAPEPTGEKK